MKINPISLLVVTAVCLNSLASRTMADTMTRRFHANLISGDVIAHGGLASTSSVTGTAQLLLSWDPSDVSTARLDYELQLVADLDGLQTATLNDDVTAIHLHDVSECMMGMHCLPGDTAHTMHVLNVLGTPRADDAQMQFFPAAGRVTGSWDVSDQNSTLPSPSFAPGEYLDELLAGRLFLMVHTRQFPNGASGGYLVPEPSTGGTLLLGALAVACRRGRQS